MSMQDTVADMLTIVRNALQAKLKSVLMPSSKLKISIAKVLQDEGYINSFSIEENENKPKLFIELKYFNGQPVIDTIKRISTPGLRIYRSVDKLPLVLGGLGIAVVSTSKGVMTDKQARTMGLGGEVLCTVS